MQEMQSDMAATISRFNANLDLPLGVRPWDFQIEGAQWLLSHPRSILADHMGLGKTLTAIVALSLETGTSLLIVAPLSAHSTWIEHLDYLRSQPSQIEIVTYSGLRKVLEKKPHWHTVIFDEAHNLRNRKAKTLYSVVNEKLTSIRCWFLTGTPVISGADNLWTLLNIVDRKKFSSYWRFAEKYCWVLDNGYGKDVTGVRNGEKLRELLEGYMLRRTVSQVFPQLPMDLRRQVVRIEPTSLQKKLLEGLEKDLEAEVSRAEFVLAQSSLVAEMKMRQLLVSPRLLGFEENGAAMQALVDELPASEPAVVFTPFRASYAVIHDVLQKHRPVFKLDGDMSARQRDLALEEFTSYIKTNDNPVMVCTIAIGTSFSLPEEVRIGVFIGYEWTPALMHQAEARFYRPARGDRGRVAKYISHIGGIVDDRIMEVLDEKVTVANIILDKYSKVKYSKVKR